MFLKNITINTGLQNEIKDIQCGCGEARVSNQISELALHSIQ